MIDPPTLVARESDLLKFTYQLSNIIENQTWKRVSFMGLLGSLGGITAILVFVTGGFFKTFANFSVDNSMISELYTLPLETPNIP